VLVDLLLHWKYEERPKLKVSLQDETFARRQNQLVQAFLLAIEFLLGIAIGYM
jgi:F0F1-type ATP synthase assembly protein I